MLTTKNKIDMLVSCFGKHAMSSSGKNISVVCPICIESGKITSKKKLSICLDTGIYHCWVCESKGGNIGKLALRYGQFVDIAKKISDIYKKNERETSQEEEKIIVSLPSDFRLLSTSMTKRSARRHIKYLQTRGFTKDDLLKFRVGYSSEYGYEGRVIFPSFDTFQNLNYFIARSINDNDFKRYRNCNAPRKDLIFREFDLDFSKPIVLTEGVFDLIHCPQNSTCMLGSWIDENYLLFKKIVENRTPVTLCLDPDAKKKSMKIAKKLYEYCIDVKLSTHEEKDFGDMSPEEVRYFIANAKPYNNAQGIEYLISEMHSGSVF